MNKNKLQPHKAKTFEFVEYVFDRESRNATFVFRVHFFDDTSEDFVEELEFGTDSGSGSFSLEKEEVSKVGMVLDRALQNLHLALGMSYFKMYFPAEIIMPYTLSQKEADFWNTLYQKGLGEYLYTNQLHCADMVQFVGDETVVTKPISATFSDRVLTGVGGGKDSIVAMEWFKEMNVEQTAFVVETGAPSSVVDEVIRVAGLETYLVKRTLDPKVFEKDRDVYNGHIPISSLFAFIGLTAAILDDYRYVALSNAQTSNHGNVPYDGGMINHAWSKSQEFEELFAEHVRNTIADGVQYFSPIRPWYELRVVKEFVNYPQYFPVFTSCNHSFKIHKERSETLWCGQCDKCVYMFIVLSAFLESEKIVAFFGKNMYQDLSLLETFKAVLGLGAHKPFDCVGAIEETQVALFLAAEKYGAMPVMQELLPLITVTENMIEQYFKSYPVKTLPVPFAFLGTQTVTIVGYGREGKSATSYLQKTFPKKEIVILDEKDNPDYLEKLSQYDVAIKSPGVSKEKITINYTTPTNLFFTEIKKRNITTIGITGTAGKSTTTSLITHILNENNFSARAMGNIGEPMLDQLGSLREGDIAVIELSSYQLDDIQYSPDVAVVINIMADHMEYHGSLKAYARAKQNITHFQNTDQKFIYNADDVTLQQWTTQTNATAIPFEKVSLEKVGIPEMNLQAAYTVARQFHISDQDIKKSIALFQNLGHRMEYVGEFKGIHFYNDARSSTPESTLLALQTIPNIETLFVGGLDRGYDFSALCDFLQKNSTIKNIVAFPDTGANIVAELSDKNILSTSSLDEAVQFAYTHTTLGMSCLLSMASPSYSLWKNFEEKGNQYKHYVQHYGTESES